MMSTRCARGYCDLETPPVGAQVPAAAEGDRLALAGEGHDKSHLQVGSHSRAAVC